MSFVDPSVPILDPRDDAAVYAWIAAWYSANDYSHTREPCNPSVCGKSFTIPVQVWKHNATGEERLAWKMVRPQWPRGTYRKLDGRSYSCVYVCKNGHTHLCSCDHCNSAETGLLVENQNGNMACIISGRVVQITREYDWREKKKGQFAPRKSRLSDPGAAALILNSSDFAASGQAGQFHNTITLKLMQSAHRCVVDCLFSKLRQELFYNMRRTKYQQILNKAQQYIKRCKRENKPCFVHHISTIAIDMGWFSNCTYETVVKAQDPPAVIQTVCPLIVAFYKCCNLLASDQILFKGFLSFSVSFLYSTVRGVKIHDVQVIPKFSNISFLLPHPSACESFMKCLWSFYEDSASPTQQNFLTKTMNLIREVLNRYLTTKEKAETFVRNCETATVSLRNQYGSVLDANLH